MAKILKIESISAIDLNSLMQEESVFLLDVRTNREFQSFKIKGAQNYPLHEVNGKIEEISNRAKAKKVISICESGLRSSSAAVTLKRKGHQVLNLKGGMAAWNAL